ncbi:uncharacterized protein V1510DRAFT_376418, partial [Dipodascopsis tothii]|uniref:uncharacterized protein n=1 Tax=Dipodascopsis tothii TaxID=44089 RepID=UPI0034CF8CFB
MRRTRRYFDSCTQSHPSASNSQRIRSQQSSGIGTGVQTSPHSGTAAVVGPGPIPPTVQRTLASPTTGTMASKRVEKAAFERNQQILKTLLKEPGNKMCSDCKRNAYPRWASWNLGVFICIRCSGIHRSMGTHISRVKSVDLDSWTDEQIQNMVSWGNVKANKYWEDGLAVGHQPADSKMENFIRTKYEMKRWAKPGPVPDPDSISDSEPDSEPAPEPVRRTAPPKKDYARSSTATTTVRPIAEARAAPRPVYAPAAPQPTVTLKSEPRAAAPAADSLLDLDFGGSVARSASAAAASIPSRPSATANMRPDLKSSILALYAAPKPASTPPVLPTAASAPPTLPQQ